LITQALAALTGLLQKAENLIRMRKAVKQAAVSVLGDVVNEFVVTDIARQDN